MSNTGPYKLLSCKNDGQFKIVASARPSQNTRIYTQSSSACAEDARVFTLCLPASQPTVYSVELTLYSKASECLLMDQYTPCSSFSCKVPVMTHLDPATEQPLQYYRGNISGSCIEHPLSKIKFSGKNYHKLLQFKDPGLYHFYHLNCNKYQLIHAIMMCIC